MKRIFLLSPLPILFILWSFIGFTPQNQSFTTFQSDSTLLKPEEIHRKKARLVTGLISYNHYNKVNPNKDISNKIFANYLDALDGNKIYLLASDVEEFEQYQYQLYAKQKFGDVSAAYKIFNIYNQRVRDRIDQVLEDLDAKKYDFTIKEYYETDREDIPWAKTQKELDDAWRKIIKSRLLSLKLAGKTYEEAVETTKKAYERRKKNLAKQTSEDVFQLYMNSFTEIYDPHTNYFSPIDSDNFKIQMKRSLEGIGAVLRSENDYVTINEVRAGGPAFKSKKLHKDDKIIGVAQGDEGEFVDIIGWRLDEAIQLIRGDKGTVVRLQIIPAAGGAGADVVEVRMVREKISLEEQSATKEIVPYEKDGKTYNIGVINLPSFYFDYEAYRRGEKDYKSTSRDVKKLLEELKKEKVDGVILDLRYNGGGSLPEAIKLTGLFIKAGPIVQVRNADGSIEVGKDTDIEQVYDGPFAVMVNRFSASASEIFSAAIQDYKRGVIIGEQTFGKGTVQNIIDLNRQVPDVDQELGHINLTLAKFYRITGSSTQNLGVTPDVALPLPYEKEDIGESSKPSALPWDEIEATDFNLYNNVSKKLIAQLNDGFKQRLGTDEDLKELVSYIEEMRTLRADTKIALQEEERKKEKEEMETKQAETKKKEEEREKKGIKDLYIKNAVQVLADMIKG